MRPESRLVFVCRVFTGSVRNHKIQEGSIARSTPSDNQESRRNVVHRKHREVPRRCDPQLASSVAVAVSCSQNLRYKGLLEIPACRDLDSCNPTTSILASREKFDFPNHQGSSKPRSAFAFLREQRPPVGSRHGYCVDVDIGAAEAALLFL